jgi:hypothetical protein
VRGEQAFLAERRLVLPPVVLPVAALRLESVPLLQRQSSGDGVSVWLETKAGTLVHHHRRYHHLLLSCSWFRNYPLNTRLLQDMRN